MPWSYLQHAKISACEDNSFAPKFACWGGVLLQNQTCIWGVRGKRHICSLLFSPLSLFKWEMLGKRQ